MDVLEAIMSRSSYRGLYEDTPVPRGDLEAILKAGMAAPSGCNKQTASFIAVDDPGVLARLKKVIRSPVGKTAPAMIVVLTQRIVAYDDRTYYIHDYSAAIQNMLLAIVGLGYQSCWVEGHVTGEDRIGRQMADVLGVPQDRELVCFLPVGVAKERAQGPAKRPFGERAWYNGFGALEA